LLQGNRHIGDASSSRARFELNRSWEQHVVLEMDVAMEVALEPRKFSHAHFVGTAAIGGHLVSASQFADRAHFVAGLEVLAFQHPNRVFFLKLAHDMGQGREGGTFLPLVPSRQELADMIGTTMETSIRIMSRWSKDGVVRTQKDGFVVADHAAL